MGKKSNNELEKIVSALESLGNNTIKSIGKNISIISDVVKNQKEIISHIKFLYKFILFVSIMQTWNVFLQEPLQEYLTPIVWWTNLSEGWQIFIVSIPVLIIVQVTGNAIFHKLFKNKP